MPVPAANAQDRDADAIAAALIEGFDRHYRLFREATQRAKALFEAGDWAGMQRLVRERIQFYDQRVGETVERLRSELRAPERDDEVWRRAKLLYLGRLIDHRQPELAESFFNSVFCRIMARSYFHNDFIFFRPAVSTEYIESEPPTYRSYYPGWDTLAAGLRSALLDVGWALPWADLDRDLGRVGAAMREYLGGQWPPAEANLQLQVLWSPFYRNKTAYLVGRIVNGHRQHPFAIAVQRDAEARLHLDTVLLDGERIALLFSLTHAYFMVDMPVPSACITFLRSIMPWLSRADLYTIVGLQKQGKTMFYRELMQHLRHSRDAFEVAPGTPGLVMMVFTLPSFPYVFKVIRDRFGEPKDIDRATVRAKYLLVKQHDRIGRMADTLEFSDVALPRDRLSPALLSALRLSCAGSLEDDGDELIIRHVYIEQRMQPLNLYLQRADAAEVERVIGDYGHALRELAQANIFPGDMLLKNFGITRHGRVVFYDYDEIEYLSDCRFRTIPEPPDPSYELLDDRWYSVARNDVFPEELAYFVLRAPAVRAAFLREHAELLTAQYWQAVQAQIGRGEIGDFFPYPQALRFGVAGGGEAVGRRQRGPGRVAATTAQA